MNTVNAATANIPAEIADATSIREPWHPPMRPLQIYLLTFLTFGVYVFVWTYRFAQDVRRHVNADVKPSTHVILSLIMFFWPFVAHKQAQYIVKWNESADLHSRLSPVGIGLFVGVLSVSSIFLNLISIGTEPAGPILGWTFIAAAIYLFLLPVPYVFMQRNINRFKETLGATTWTRKPYRFTGGHYVTMAIGLLVYALVGYTASEPMGGERLEAGVPVGGATGLYTLTPDTGDWIHVPAGTIVDGADLELYGFYGSMAETSVAVYVMPRAGQTLDDVVRFRRSMVETDVSDVSFQEHRGFLPGAMTPVSYARYESKLLGFDEVLLVTTIETSDALIEVVGITTGDYNERRAVEALVSSVRLSGNTRL